MKNIYFKACVWYHRPGFFYFIAQHRIPRGTNAFLQEALKRIENPSDGVKIFQTQSMGRGLKTTRKFCKGEVVAEYTGEILFSRQDFLEREALYLNDPNLSPGGYIFGFNLGQQKYWLVQFLSFFSL